VEEGPEGASADPALFFGRQAALGAVLPACVLQFDLIQLNMQSDRAEGDRK
jgi:hypothetical protein